MSYKKDPDFEPRFKKESLAEIQFPFEEADEHLQDTLGKL